MATVSKPELQLGEPLPPDLTGILEAEIYAVGTQRIRLQPRLATAVYLALEPYTGKAREKAIRSFLAARARTPAGTYEELTRIYQAAIAAVKP